MNSMMADCPGSVGDGDVQRLPLGVLLTERRVDHLHLVEIGDHLVHGGVIVEVELRPLIEGDAGPLGIAGLVLGLVEEEEIDDEALLVDALPRCRCRARR